MSERFELAADPQGILERQRAERPELSHLSDAKVVCIFTAVTPLLLRGWPCYAFVAQPTVQGPMRSWFDWLVEAFCYPVLQGDEPEFVILFDANLWAEMTEERRDRLVYHELLHIQTRNDEHGVPRFIRGKLALRLVPHDRELFDAELLRYGAKAIGHGDLAGVIRDGETSRRQQKREARSV
jgi:hypothetical protein